LKQINTYQSHTKQTNKTNETNETNQTKQTKQTIQTRQDKPKMSTTHHQDVANLLLIISRPNGTENLRYKVGIKTNDICLELSKLWIGDCNIDAILTEMWGKDFIFHDEYGESCDCHGKGMWRQVAAGKCPCARGGVQAGADVNAARTDNGCTPMFVAAEKGHLEVVRVLVEAGADVNAAKTTDGATPVFIAAQNGHLEVVRALVLGKE